MSATPQIRIVLDGPTPVYRQIVDQVRTLCVEGALKPGSSLPSVRQLAASLGVHFNTVAEAYRALAEEGWLDVRQGRSVQIVERSEPRQPTRAASTQHSSRLRHLVAELRATGFSPEWIRREVDSALEGNSL
ncbi:MAG: GntR family transcriptional regulator [Acidobacteriaceae bacterium]